MMIKCFNMRRNVKWEKGRNPFRRLFFKKIEAVRMAIFLFLLPLNGFGFSTGVSAVSNPSEALQTAFSVLRNPSEALRTAFSVLRNPSEALRTAFSMLRNPSEALRTAFSVLRNPSEALQAAFCRCGKTRPACGKACIQPIILTL
jgi:hypothetical protein